MSMDKVEQRNIVIIGGGIIGCSIAYYLTRHPSYSTSTTSIIVLEASANGVAQGASGKAGGLIAKWAYPREIVDISFPEHVKLAEEHNGAERWGWRFVGCGSWEGEGEALGESGSGVGKGGKRKSLEKTLGFDATVALASRTDKGLPDDLTWVKEDLTTSYSPMSGPDGTAQVHPYLFTTSMLDLAKEKGVQLVKGTAISIEQVNRHVTAVTYRDRSDSSRIETLPATHVVLSAGAWSPSIIPSLPIPATRAHSVTIHPKAGVTISPYVLFTEILLPAHSLSVSPEIYARPDNEVYACGPGDDSILPGNVDDVEVDLAACQSITNHVASISQELREGAIDKRQACFLPVVRTGGGPIIGEADKIAKGLYIATGHTCWGICNAPGTAKVIAELIMGRKVRSRNLTKLAPSRFL